MHQSHSFYLGALLLILIAPFSFGAALSGTGCTQPTGNCVVSSSQTIDTGTAYYFNSLVINPGVTVTLASPGSGAGGTVYFYVANDANISGAIAANGVTYAGNGGSNPNGGGYGGADASGFSAGGGGGVIIIAARNLNILSTGILAVNGGVGTGSSGSSGGGAGSGGTVMLYGKSIKFQGTITGNGGTGNVYGGGGAGGSLVFMPLTTANLTSGSINFNGGNYGGSGNYNHGGSGSGGAGGAGYSAPGGAGSGGPSSTSNYNAGPANANRNIKMYNVVIPSGSAFSISSAGGSGYQYSGAAGLMDVYLAPSSSKFSGLSVTYRTEKILAAAFNASFYPIASANFTFTDNTGQQPAFSVLTDSSGSGVSSSTLLSSSNYTVTTRSIASGATVSLDYYNASGFPSGYNSTVANSSNASMYVFWAANGQINITLNSALVPPNATTFGGASTNLSTVSDLTNVTNLTLAIPGDGMIHFPQSHSVNTAGQDYDANVKIGNGFVSVNSSALDPSFNSSATIVLTPSGVNYGAATPSIYYYPSFTSSSSVILQNGTLCTAPRCTGISWNATANALTFNVIGFSGYAIAGGKYGFEGTLGINITSTNQIAVYTASARNNSAFSFVPVVPPAAGSITLKSNESSNVTGGDTGFLVENQGNVNVSITVASDSNASAFIGGSAPLFQTFGAENKTGSCPGINSSMQDLGASSVTVCPSLGFPDTADTIWAYVLVKIDSDSPPQTNTATLTFTSTQN